MVYISVDVTYLYQLHTILNISSSTPRKRTKGQSNLAKAPSPDVRVEDPHLMRYFLGPIERPPQSEPRFVQPVSAQPARVTD